MAQKWIVNSFTPAMLAVIPSGRGANVRFTSLSDDEARDLVINEFSRFRSAIGHAATADVISAKLGEKCIVNRETLKLFPDDEVLIAQLQGPRLPEGKVLTAEEVNSVGVAWVLATVEV